MTITLSLDAIMAQILSESALRYHLSDNAPDLLSPDNATALETLVRARFSIACLDLLPILDDMDDGNETDSRQLTLEVHSLDAPAMVLLKHAMEHALAIGTLAYIYADTSSDAADEYSRAFSGIRSRITDIVLLSGLTTIGSITPCRY